MTNANTNKLRHSPAAKLSVFKNEVNLLICQFRAVMILATPAYFWAQFEMMAFASVLSTFCNHVLGICQAVAKKEMAWVATWRVIACVANHVIARINTVVKEIGKPASSQFLPSTVYAYMNDSVTVLVAQFLPRPAFVRQSNSNLCPELFNSLRCQLRKWYIWPSHNHLLLVRWLVGRAFSLREHSESPINTGILSYLAPTR